MRAIPITLRILSLVVLLALLVADLQVHATTPADAQTVAAATCYKLDRTITCTDDPKKDFCQAYPKVPLLPESCRMQFDARAGSFKLTCPQGSSAEWVWKPPPETWCSDQDVQLSGTINFSGSGSIAGKYWGIQALQLGPVSGINPFDWLEVSVTKSSLSKSGSVGGVHPLPGMKEGFSIGVVASGWGIKPGGNATDSAGSGVEYVYKVVQNLPPLEVAPLPPPPPSSLGGSALNGSCTSNNPAVDLGLLNDYMRGLLANPRSLEPWGGRDVLPALLEGRARELYQGQRAGGVVRCSWWGSEPGDSGQVEFVLSMNPKIGGCECTLDPSLGLNEAGVESILSQYIDEGNNTETPSQVDSRLKDRILSAIQDREGKGYFQCTCRVHDNDGGITNHTIAGRYFPQRARVITCGFDDEVHFEYWGRPVTDEQGQELTPPMLDIDLLVSRLMDEGPEGGSLPDIAAAIQSRIDQQIKAIGGQGKWSCRLWFPNGWKLPDGSTTNNWELVGSMGSPNR